MTETAIPFWPWQVWRQWNTKLRDMEVRHAKERAALTAWIVECEYVLREGVADE